MTSLDELERLAQEARSVGWYSRGFFESFIGDDDERAFEDADARYFSALDPTTVLDLIAKARLGEAWAHKARAAVEALPGYRDPRYSGTFEAVGLVGREDVLAALDALTAELEKG